MSLKKIYIDGVKNIEDTEYLLTNKNLLLDFNGTGKTGFMEAVAILVTGKHPTAGDRLADIIGLLPQDKKKMVIEGAFKKDIIRREFIRGVDGNTQNIIINGDKVKTKAAETLIKEIVGDFVSSFNIREFGEMTEKEKQEALFLQFADKLSKLTCEDILEDCSIQILKETEFYNGVLKYVYDKASIVELTKEERKQFKEKIIEKFSEQKNLFKHFQHITEKLFPKIKKGAVQDFIEKIVETIKTYKNDLQQEVEATQKSLEKDREILDAKLNVPQLKEDKKKNVDFLSVLEKNVEDNKVYLEAKKTYNTAMSALVLREVEDDKDLKIKLKNLEKETANYDKIFPQYEMELKVNYLEDIANAKASLGRKAEAEKKLNQKLAELTTCEKDLKLATTKKDKGEDVVAELNKKYNKAKDVDATILQEILSADTVFKEYTFEEKEIQKLLENFKDGKCPICLTKVAQITLNIDAKKERLSVLADLIKKQETIIIKLNSAEHGSLGLIEGMRQKLHIHGEKLDKISVDISKLDGNKEALAKSIKELKTEISNINVTPEAIAITEKKQKDFLDLESKIKKLQEKIREINVVKDDLKKIADDVESNKTLDQRKKSLSKPKVVPIDDKIGDAIENYKQIIKNIEENLEAALENQGIQKKINRLEGEILQLVAATKFVRKACAQIEGYKYHLISDLLRPVQDRANKIYKPIFGDEVVFDVEKCGIWRNKNYVPLKYMSGGQKTVFTGALISAIMDESDLKTKILCIEASEVDDAGLHLLLRSMSDVVMDNLFISAYPRENINMKPGNQPEGWNSFAIR